MSVGWQLGELRKASMLRNKISEAFVDRLLAMVRDELQGFTSDTNDRRWCVKQLVRKLEEEAK